MRVNSVKIQNYNKKQVNFGCDYCRLTKEMLVDHGFKGYEVEATLLRVNPKDLGPKIAKILKGTPITPDKLHLGRANAIYEVLTNSERKNLKNLQEPGALEKSITEIIDTFDCDLALRTGSHFNIDLDIMKGQG